MVGGGRERHHGSLMVGWGVGKDTMGLRVYVRGGAGKDIRGEGQERHHRSLMVEGGG